MSVYVFGAEQLAAVLQRAPGRARRALAIALYAEGQKVMARSKTLYVPVDTGVLRASGTVKAPELVGPTTVTVTLGYGGAARAYAVIQHEDTTLSHPPKNPRKRYTKKGRLKATPRAGQAKYLERPLLEATPTIYANLANSCAAMFTKAGL